jgi:ribonuclease BN (tRNA processing enzyme)
MSIRLTCLGGAAAWPNPGQGCSSFLVASNGTTILLDVGPDTLLELRKHIDFSRIGAIVISHCHSDHILDLVPYRYGLVYGPTKPAEPIPLWLPPGGRHILDALASALGGQGESSSNFWDSAFKITEYDPAQPIDIDGVSISFQRTVHPAECYAMRLTSDDGKVLTYSADTGDVESLSSFAMHSDILIGEGTMPEDTEASGQDSGHLRPSEAGELASRASAKRLVVSHLWSERPDEEVIGAVRTQFEGEILIAKPGLTVDA